MIVVRASGLSMNLLRSEFQRHRSPEAFVVAGADSARLHQRRTTDIDEPARCHAWQQAILYQLDKPRAAHIPTEHIALNPALHLWPRLEASLAAFNRLDPALDFNVPRGIGIRIGRARCTDGLSEALLARKKTLFVAFATLNPDSPRTLPVADIVQSGSYARNILRGTDLD